MIFGGGGRCNSIINLSIIGRKNYMAVIQGKRNCVAYLTLYYSDSFTSDDEYSPPEQLKIIDPTKSPIKYVLCEPILVL